MKKNLLWAVPAFLLLLTACQTDQHISSRTDVGTPVTFKAPSLIVRATGAHWDKDDQIGVIMYQADKLIAQANYTTPRGNGDFEANNTPLYYPNDGSQVGFVAYYPYTPTAVHGTTYSIDLAKHPEVLLTANNVTEASVKEPAGALYFTHPLSQLSLTLQSDKPIPVGIQLTATLSGLPTQANLSMRDGALSVTQQSVADYTTTFNTTADGAALQALLPVLPGVDASKATLTITAPGGKVQTVKLMEKYNFVAGQSINVSVHVEGLEIETPSTLKTFRETPVITPAQLKENRYVIHYMQNSETDRNWAMLFSPEYRIAYWVAYPLTTDMMGSTKRTDQWEYDPGLPKEVQADLSSSYPSKTYDRGHQLPSADRTASFNANASTFFYSNMTPQVGKLNQNLWADLENKVRSWVSGVDTLFVVTGAMPTSPNDNHVSYTEDRRGTKVAIPQYYFKALARRIGNTYYTIAFKMNNEVPTDNRYTNYALSVSELEKITGFTFFPSIPTAQKANFDLNKWQ